MLQARSLGLELYSRNGGFQAFELKLELFDLPSNLLRLALELHAPQLGDQQFQVLDLGRESPQPAPSTPRVQLIEFGRRGRIHHKARMP